MKIWQTYRNADENEGRGPMVPDLAFLHRQHAVNYIDNQPGVMGRRCKWSKEKYGDWNMKEIEVLEYDYQEIVNRKEELKTQALSKLTKEEKEALGLI